MVKVIITTAIGRQQPTRAEPQQLKLGLRDIWKRKQTRERRAACKELDGSIEQSGDGRVQNLMSGNDYQFSHWLRWQSMHESTPFESVHARKAAKVNSGLGVLLMNKKILIGWKRICVIVG